MFPLPIAGWRFSLLSHAGRSHRSLRSPRGWNQTGFEASVETVSSCTRTSVLFVSIGCDPAAFCRFAQPLHTVSIAKKRRQPVHPLPLFATQCDRPHTGDLFIRCMESSGIRQSLRILCILPPSEGTRRPHRGLRPQLVHKARLIIRSKAVPRKGNSFTGEPSKASCPLPMA